MSSRTLPPLNFTATEMVAITVSLAREENTSFAAATRSALRKVLATASAAQTAEAGEADGPGPADRRGPPGRGCARAAAPETD